MKLKEPAEIDHLVDHHPYLDRDRRAFIADHLKGVKPEEHERLYRVFEGGMEPEEMEFVRILFGEAEPAPRSGTPFLLLDGKESQPEGEADV